MLHGRPAKCTGIKAFVFEVIPRFDLLGIDIIVFGSMSARTGVAPRGRWR